MAGGIRNEASYLAQHDAIPDEMELAPGFTAAQLKAALARPAEDPAGSRFLPSVTFSEAAGDVAQMALYARTDTSQRAPIVVFVHGGGFIAGHHFTSIRYCVPLAARGFVAATMTYRLADEAPWPASLEDAKCAVRWLRQHAHELGGDPDRIVMVGESAGSLLAALVALTPGDREGDGGWVDVSSELQAVALMYPPADIEATAERARAAGSDALDEYFGDGLAAASPMAHVHPGAPPVLSLTGGDDELTTAEDIARFHDALQQAGVDNRFEVFDGAGHSFDFLPANQERCLALLLEFLEATVGAA